MSDPKPASRAARKLEFQMVFSTLLVGVALFLSWLLLAESSPFHDFFREHQAVPDAWRMTMFVPFVVSAIITRNPHSPSTAVLIMVLITQWFLVGLIISGPLFRLFERR